MFLPSILVVLRLTRSVPPCCVLRRSYPHRKSLTLSLRTHYPTFLFDLYPSVTSYDLPCHGTTDHKRFLTSLRYTSFVNLLVFFSLLLSPNLFRPFPPCLSTYSSSMFYLYRVQIPDFRSSTLPSIRPYCQSKHRRCGTSRHDKQDYPFGPFLVPLSSRGKPVQVTPHRKEI